jgi:hypothetical protein
MRAIRLTLLLVAVLIASELTSFAASSRSLLDDPTRLDRRVRLLGEARSYFHNNKNDTEQMLRAVRESVTRRGGVIPELAGDPPRYPSGKLTKTDVTQRKLRVGDRLRCDVAGNVTITAETAERFAIQLIVIVRHLETRPIAASGRMRVARLGDGNVVNVTTDTLVRKPGRHEVLFILAAHPINGGKPAILGVEDSTFDVAQR